MKTKKIISFSYHITKCIALILFTLHSSLFLTLSLSMCTFSSFSQGVAINVTGDSAANSAILDIQSDTTSNITSQGLLIPRMSTLKRPVNPASGLQIFNTTTNCVEIYYGNAWQSISCLCKNAPTAAGTISGTTTVCPGQNAVLYSVPAISGATNYIWSYSGTGAYIVGATNAVIVYFSGTATSGNLTVKGTNACGNGTVSSDYAIAVNSTAPNITIQPTSVNTCLGSGSESFSVTATGGLSYQWQEYTSSWNNLSNAGIYSNVTSATLTIANPTLEMNGYKYRCVVSGTCTNTTSDGLATLTINSNPTLTGASQSAAVCAGSSATINLTGLTASSTSTVSYKINNIAQTAITGVVANSSGEASFTSASLISGNNGQTLQITGITSATSNCTETFTQNVTLTVINTPSQPGAISGNTFAFPNSTGNVYSISPISGATSYTWSLPSGSSITAGTGTTSVTVSFGSVFGNVSVSATNSCGTSEQSSLTVTQFSATGGTITTITGYKVHTFTTSGTFTPNGIGNVEYLVIGGGGGGGRTGGGGGAGGYKTGTNYSVTAQAYSITVGTGGAGNNVDGQPGGSGNNSIFDAITSTGGGGGGSHSANGTSGGSGGGGGSIDGGAAATGGAASPSGQGYAGGNGNTGGASRASGGGGGANATGGTGSNGTGGVGGAGISNNISGSSVTYAGGGGGSGASTGGAGGVGGGGNGKVSPNVGDAGTANRGGGGGGGADTSGGNGGSGIVIIRYPN